MINYVWLQYKPDFIEFNKFHFLKPKIMMVFGFGFGFNTQQIWVLWVLDWLEQILISSIQVKFPFVLILLFWIEESKNV